MAQLRECVMRQPIQLPQGTTMACAPPGSDRSSFPFGPLKPIKGLVHATTDGCHHALGLIECFCGWFSSQILRMIA